MTWNFNLPGMTVESFESRPGLTMRAMVAGEGPLIVLVHGLFGTHATWERVAPILVNSGFKVVIPDLLGFGNSSRTGAIGDLWVDSQARAILQLSLRFGARSAALVGHDYGGPICVAVHKLQRTFPGAIVLSNCNLATDTPIPFPINIWRWSVVGSIFQNLVLSRPSLQMSIRQANVSQVRLPVNDYLGDAEQINATRLIFRKAILNLETAYRPVEEELPHIQVPVSVIWGDRDPFFHIERGRRTAARISGAVFRRLEGCGHFCPEERPVEYANEVLAAVARVKSTVVPRAL